AISSSFVIFAAPRFVGAKVVANQKFSHTQDLSYAPWMVANISLKNLPDARGLAPAWDNVSYYSDSLGYVMANHQEITTRAKPNVITYYYPLSENDPKISRQALYTANAEQWSHRIVEDLQKMHPTIASEIISMDLWPWGHGMIRPSVGFIWGDVRRQMKERDGNIIFAHSDMSGMSNFEEAQYHGVEAAKTVLSGLASG
ncbi:MAG: FAD-dependent oxidoreductase, partial [Candidatus Melainabacteria bacterium]|nr:FAD-dependent oxidoreductase [Candidatus Melainabacteria bacterium]